MVAYLSLAHPELAPDDRVEFLELVSGMDARYFAVEKELRPEKETEPGKGSK